MPHHIELDLTDDEIEYLVALAKYGADGGDEVGKTLRAKIVAEYLTIGDPIGDDK